MSGVVELKSRSAFVYVEVSVGLKVQKGNEEQRDRAREANRSRMDEAEKEAKELAVEIRDLVKNYVKKEKLDIKFTDIEDIYSFYKKGMSGFSTFPTYTSTEEAAEHSGKKAYFLVHQSPLIVLRFTVLPDFDLISKISKLIKQQLSEKTR